MKGWIVSVNTKGFEEPHSVEKGAQPTGAVLGSWGFVGDYHNRAMRPSFSVPGTLKPNIDRHVSLLAIEVIDSLNTELGLDMRSGTLGENITTRGLGDLSHIADGSRLVIKNSLDTELAILRVIEQNQPCKNLHSKHRLLVKKIYGRRGLLCVIERGVGKRICRNDSIEFFP